MDIREFFKDCLKDFDKPDNWVDVCYLGGDVCPSFEYNGYHIMVNHPDPERRELKGSFRFLVRISLEYAEHGWTFCAETIEEILPEIEVPYLTRPLIYDREYYLAVDLLNVIKSEQKEEARKSA